jgi:hypothetical protein
VNSNTQIGNLSFYTTEEQIYEIFSKCASLEDGGGVKRVIMGLDKNTRCVTLRRCALHTDTYHTTPAHHVDSVSWNTIRTLKLSPLCAMFLVPSLTSASSGVTSTLATRMAVSLDVDVLEGRSVTSTGRIMIQDGVAGEPRQRRPRLTGEEKSRRDIRMPGLNLSLEVERTGRHKLRQVGTPVGRGSGLQTTWETDQRYVRSLVISSVRAHQCVTAFPYKNAGQWSIIKQRIVLKYAILMYLVDELDANSRGFGWAILFFEGRQM